MSLFERAMMGGGGKQKPAPIESKEKMSELRTALDSLKELIPLLKNKTMHGGDELEIMQVLVKVQPYKFPQNQIAANLAILASQMLEAFQNMQNASATVFQKRYDIITSQVEEIEISLFGNVQQTQSHTTSTEVESNSDEMDSLHDLIEKPKFDVVDIDFTHEMIGKNIQQVSLNLPDDEIEHLLNIGKADYMEIRTSYKLFFVIEGIDGVFVPAHDPGDGYRSYFGGWKLIKKAPFSIIKDMGIIESIQEYDERPQNADPDGYNRGTRVITDGRSQIEFGEISPDAYYPSGYCTVY